MPDISPKNDSAIHNFIFDLDGTLLDTLPDLVLLTNSILSELGFPERSQDEILSFVGNGVRRLMIQALPKNADQDAEDKAMDLWNEKFYDYYEHTFPYAGTVEMLDTLKRGVRSRRCVKQAAIGSRPHNREMSAGLLRSNARRQPDLPAQT